MHMIPSMSTKDKFSLLQDDKFELTHEQALISILIMM